MFRNYGQNGWHKHTYIQHSHGWMLVVHLCTNTSTIFTHIVFKSWIGAIYNIQFLILRSLKDCHMHKLPLGNITIFKFCVYVQYIYCTFWQLYLANIVCEYISDIYISPLILTSCWQEIILEVNIQLIVSDLIAAFRKNKIFIVIQTSFYPMQLWVRNKLKWLVLFIFVL